MATVSLSFNIDSPRWDQSTFVGRLKHFLNITDPRTVLVPEEELDQAKALVEGCRWEAGIQTGEVLSLCSWPWQPLCDVAEGWTHSQAGVQ